MIEIWKPVVGFEKTHEISNLGRLRSLPRDCKFGKDNKKTRIVQQIKNGRVIAEYYGCAEAGAAVGIGKSAISAVCLGKRKSSKGYQWRYK